MSTNEHEELTFAYKHINPNVRRETSLEDGVFKISPVLREFSLEISIDFEMVIEYSL